jgi:hypothetical protein
MAHYRKIEVDGVTYEYVVGRPIDEYHAEVTPAHIKEFIRREVLRNR